MSYGRMDNDGDEMPFMPAPKAKKIIKKVKKSKVVKKNYSRM